MWLVLNFAVVSEFKDYLRLWLFICATHEVMLDGHAKDIFVWIVGPWRSVNYFNCTV